MTTWRSRPLLWADAGYASQIDASLVTWARKAAGIALEIVKRSEDVWGFQVLPRRWGRGTGVRLADPGPAAQP